MTGVPAAKAASETRESERRTLLALEDTVRVYLAALEQADVGEIYAALALLDAKRDGGSSNG